MVLFRITNALLLLLAASWWFFNRQSDMAEPIVAIFGCSIAVIEIVGEVIAAKGKSHQESQASLESEVLPDVLDRIKREESNIQQVIDGRRKQAKVIEEYPIELIEPHVPKLKKLSRFSRLASRLQAQLDRNKKLPAGEKQFEELQAVLREIDSLARRPLSGGQNWFSVLYLVVAVSVGVCGAAIVRLPLDKEITTPSEEQPDTSAKAVESNAPQGDE